MEGDRGEVSLSLKCPVIMSQASLVKQISENVPSVPEFIRQMIFPKTLQAPPAVKPLESKSLLQRGRKRLASNGFLCLNCVVNFPPMSLEVVVELSAALEEFQIESGDSGSIGDLSVVAKSFENTYRLGSA